MEDSGSLKAPAQLTGKQYELSNALWPGEASIACMLSAAYISQRLRLLSTLIIQQRTETADGSMSSPSGCKDRSLSPNNQIKIVRGPAVSPRLCLEKADPDARKPQGAGNQHLMNVLQSGHPGGRALHPDIASEAVSALTKDEKLRAQHSTSRLRATDSLINDTLQMTEACSHHP